MGQIESWTLKSSRGKIVKLIGKINGLLELYISTQEKYRKSEKKNFFKKYVKI